MAEDLKPFVRIETVTPSKANAWIQKNHEQNRTRRKNKVNEYAEDMAHGRWLLSTAVLAFDTAGNLINGQHTLEAVIKSNATIEIIVLRNASDASILVMDSGMKRNSDDHFHMARRGYPKGCGSTVRAILGSMQPKGAISDLVIDEFMQSYETQVAQVHSATANVKRCSAKIRAVLVRARITHKLSEERMIRFAEILNTGLGRPGESAVVLLRNKMIDFGNKGSANYSGRKELYALAQKAVYYYSIGEETGRLVPATSELFAIPEDKVVATPVTTK